jgi:hypothetical protein
MGQRIRLFGWNKNERICIKFYIETSWIEDIIVFPEKSWCLLDGA